MDDSPAWWKAVADLILWMIPPSAGATVSILVGKDFSVERIVGGYAAAFFSAFYFTDPLLASVPLPPDINPSDARSMAGALIGTTAYVAISRLIEIIQTGDVVLFGGKFRLTSKKTEEKGEAANERP